MPASATPSAREQMDAIYRYQRFVYDVTRRFYLLGRDRLIADLRVPVGGDVLEIGCGTGRNLIAAARMYPSAQFYGLDVSANMLATARSKLDKQGLEPRIRLAEADATSFDAVAEFNLRAFDRVFFSYALSMIPGWRQALERAYACVAAGGSLHVVDFGQMEHTPPLFRPAMLGWLAHFSVTPRPGLQSALASLAAKHGGTLGYESRFGGYWVIAVLRKS